MMLRGWVALTALVLAFALAGCSRTDPSVIAELPDSTGAQGVTNTDVETGPVALTIQADPSGQLKFTDTTMNAVAGQAAIVTFQNPAPLPHSWVLVEQGQEEAVNEAAQAQNGDITGITGVIAGSEVLNANETDLVEVPPQPAGSYMYICTVPGHYAAGMKGTMIFGEATAGTGGEEASDGAATGAATGGDAAAGPVAVAADPSGQLKYQETSLQAQADTDFTVDFANPAPVPHNWVLVEPGQEEAVATASAAKAGDPTGITGVIAGHAPIQGGSETIDVPARPAGTYPYICTVPGHYAAGMKGELTLAP